MVDRNSARSLVVKYQADRDERLVQLLGHVLQALHTDRTPARLMLEVQVLNEMIDSYENLGRFSEAEQLRVSRVLVVHEHQVATGGIRVTEMREVA